MSAGRATVRTVGEATCVALLISLTAVPPAPADADRCQLPSQHAGVAFDLSHLDPRWTCRLQPILGDYTTANKVGPMRTPLPKPLYDYLLDHPVVAAALVNRLELGLHKASVLGPDRYWGSDGEGTEGIVELIHHDPTTRIYVVDGRHDGRFLPQVTGKAVVLMKIRPVTEPDGRVAMETILIAYTRVDNRFLSGVLSLLRPLVGKVVTRQLLKGFDAAHKLALIMRQDPQRVLFEATDPPALPPEDVALLKTALATLHNPDHPATP